MHVMPRVQCLPPAHAVRRYLLTAAGIAAVCCVEAQQEQHVQRAKVPYLCLDLGQLPAAVRQQYVAVGVWVEAEGHDQVGRAVWVAQGVVRAHQGQASWKWCWSWAEHDGHKVSTRAQPAYSAWVAASMMPAMSHTGCTRYNHEVKGICYMLNAVRPLPSGDARADLHLISYRHNPPHDT